MKSKYLVDLFAGAGGLSCGLEMAGFTPVLANEIDPHFANTYKKNHPDTEVATDDIKVFRSEILNKFKDLKLGELDLLAGGPPCQGFSVNAPIRSLDDERNHLFKDFLFIANLLRPKAILIENVPGIVSLGQGTVVKQIYKELTSLGYSVSHKILFAGHYGVPQMRFRTIFVGIRGLGKTIIFPDPSHNAHAVANFRGGKDLCLNLMPLFSQHLKPKTSVWDAISDLPEIEAGNNISTFEYPTKPSTEYQKILRSGSKRVKNHISSKLACINLQRLKHIPQGGSWRDIPFELLPNGLKRARRTDHTKRYGRLDPSGLCSTILTKCDPHWGSFFHPTQDRVISVREAARFQSFPDTYVFHGSITQQYEEVGNAVPPFLAKSIGDSISQMLGIYFGQ